MRVKRIEFVEEVRDVTNDNIDVFVENEDGYTYTISVCTPQDFLEEMKQEKTNFVRPGGTIMIVVKKLTEDIVTEAIQAYAENDGYWLKLHQFAASIGISTLNQLEAEHRKEQQEFDLICGLDDLKAEINKLEKLEKQKKSALVASLDKLSKLLED